MLNKKSKNNLKEWEAKHNLLFHSNIFKLYLKFHGLSQPIKLKILVWLKKFSTKIIRDSNKLNKGFLNF